MAKQIGHRRHPKQSIQIKKKQKRRRMVSRLRRRRQKRKSRQRKTLSLSLRSRRRSRRSRSRRLSGGSKSLKTNFRRYGDNIFGLVWNVLTFAMGKINRDPLSKNNFANLNVFRLTSDPFVQATMIKSLNYDTFDQSRKRSIIFFQGLGTSLSEALDTCEAILNSFETLGFVCTVYVMDQMQSISMDLLVASAAEMIERATRSDTTIPVLLIGYSLGTGVACYGLLRWYESYVDAYSKETKETIPSYPKLVLLSPFTSISDVTEMRTRWDDTNLLKYTLGVILGHNFELSDAIQKMPFSVFICSTRDDNIIAYEQFLKLGEVRNLVGELPSQVTIEGNHLETRNQLANPEFVKNFV
jgi:hypothetical protein